MLISAQSVLIPPRPQSFAALMEMYEINYLQLRLLCGDIRNLNKEKVSRVAEHVPVKLSVMENSRHTTTLMLTYLFQESGVHRKNRPDMLVRVYHDSRQAEVIQHRCRLSDEPLKYWGKDMDTMLLCRWRMNRFLYKWTNYLRKQGYSFT